MPFKSIFVSKTVATPEGTITKGWYVDPGLALPDGLTFPSTRQNSKISVAPITGTYLALCSDLL